MDNYRIHCKICKRYFQNLQNNFFSMNSVMDKSSTFLIHIELHKANKSMFFFMIQNDLYKLYFLLKYRYPSLPLKCFIADRRNEYKIHYTFVFYNLQHQA